MDTRKTVGYVRTSSKAEDGKMQKKIITQYCKVEGIQCEAIYVDYGYTKRKEADIWKAKRLDIKCNRYCHTYNGWESMLMAVMDGEIGRILVDNRIRLYCNEEQRRALNKVCQDYNVEVVEVSLDNVPMESACKRIAIYHFTNAAEKRPSVGVNDIDRLYQYASQHSCWEVVHLYLDSTLRKFEQKELQRLLENLGKYDIILVKSFYHISKKISSFWTIVMELKRNGVNIVSMQEGQLFCVSCDDLLEKQLKVVVYDKARTDLEKVTQQLNLKRMEVFVKYKAKSWNIVKVYADRNDQTEILNQLIEESKEYDLILVDTLGKIHENTANFFKFKKQINCYLFSMREGGIA